MSSMARQWLCVLVSAGFLWMAATGCQQSKEGAKVKRLAEIRQFVQLRASYQQMPDYYAEGGTVPDLNSVVATSGLDLSGYETTPDWANMDVYGEVVVIREKAMKDGVRAVGRADGVVEFIGE